jgi:NAD(P)H dehydrogenase (quinone)
MTELAEEVSRQTKQTVAYKNLPRTEYKSALLGAGLPEGLAELLVDSDEGIARGELNDSSGDLEHRTGCSRRLSADLRRIASLLLLA